MSKSQEFMLHLCFYAYYYGNAYRFMLRPLLRKLACKNIVSRDMKTLLALLAFRYEQQTQLLLLLLVSFRSF